jgi:serine/alanine adding enzyme
MKIIFLDDKNEKHLEMWKKFLGKEKHLLIHTVDYKHFIDNAFKCKTYYVGVILDEKIKTILPVFYVDHILLGKKLISSSFLEYGSFCGDKKYVVEIVNFLYKEFSDKAEFLEIRHGLEGYDKELKTLMKKTDEYKRAVLHLGKVEDVWKGIQKSKRKAVKKAETEGVKIRLLTKDDIKEIYKLYAKNMRDFGSPGFGKKFFTSFFDNIANKGYGRVYGSFVNEKLSSVLLGFTYEDAIHITISVSDKKYSAYRVNDAVHWEFIKYGCRGGFKVFDFGRVREDSGQHEYKRKWGTEIFELPHYYLLWRANSIPRVDPNNPKYKAIVWLWKRVPVFVSRSVGPWLREGLGI